MGVQFFGGKFFKCVDENGERLSVNVCNIHEITLSKNVLLHKMMSFLTDR